MDQKLVEKFIEVTGESEATAHRYLILADGNVEMAISLMLESVQPIESEHTDLEPVVRPPILPTQEVLIPPDAVCSFPRVSDNVFDRFRDFAVETQRQEEELTRRATGVKKASQCKQKRLEDLFRPPCDILFLGTFLEAREHAKILNRWLLVNVQNPQEFACQILNRDVWPDRQIKEIVKDHFVLWQVLSNTNDGKRYIDFYNVAEYPYLAVIDPRTGECIRTQNQITVDSLISDLNDILSTHPSPDSAPSEDGSNNTKCNRHTPRTSKQKLSPDRIPNTCEYNSNNSSSSGSNSNSNKQTTSSTIEGEESGSSKSSTKNGIVNTNIPRSGPNTTNKRRRLDELEAKESSKEEKEQSNNNRPNSNKVEMNMSQYLDAEPLVRLCLRVPSGGKETISFCATDTIENFLKKMEDMGYPTTEYTYLVSYPKTNVGALPPEIRLLDTILFPSNTVFITKI